MPHDFISQFGTDNAKPCEACKGTVAGYRFGWAVDRTIKTFCYGCHKQTTWQLPKPLSMELTAAQLSTMHRAS